MEIHAPFWCHPLWAMWQLLHPSLGDCSPWAARRMAGGNNSYSIHQRRCQVELAVSWTPTGAFDSLGLSKAMVERDTLFIFAWQRTKFRACEFMIFKPFNWELNSGFLPALHVAQIRSLASPSVSPKTSIHWRGLGDYSLNKMETY